MPHERAVDSGDGASAAGLVTFLFTDIEGSTRLVNKLRDGYAAVMSQHQEILRAAFARFNNNN